MSGSGGTNMCFEPLKHMFGAQSSSGAVRTKPVSLPVSLLHCRTLPVAGGDALRYA